VTNAGKHLRPISLTLALSKVAEDFVVVTHIAPAIVSIINPDQFGAIPKSSTTQALISVIHKWSAEATDATGAAVRIMLDHMHAGKLLI
jgi:hypothetical protein